MIPPWLEPHLRKECACGWPIGNNTELTLRMCLNPECPYHMAQKVADLAKEMNVKGVGPAKALELVKRYKFKTHLEAIPLWFEEKPSKHLHEIISLSMIHGLDKKAHKYCDGFNSFTEMFSHPEKLPQEILVWKNVLLKAETFFKVKPALSTSRVNIMITGEIHDVASRSCFVSALNQMYGHRFQIVDVGVRKTGVMCLIREEDAPIHNKTRIAMERNIPILTPKEFIGILDSIINEGGESEDAD